MIPWKKIHEHFDLVKEIVKIRSERIQKELGTEREKGRTTKQHIKRGNSDISLGVSGLGEHSK